MTLGSRLDSSTLCQNRTKVSHVGRHGAKQALAEEGARIEARFASSRVG
jgi:hypothetical protein